MVVSVILEQKEDASKHSWNDGEIEMAPCI